MQWDAFTTPTTTTTTSTFPLFPPKPTSSFPFPSSSSSSTRFEFRSLKTRSTANNNGFLKQKPISEMSLYELLGIPETVTLPEIKQAYKQLARKYHPDVSPPNRVQEYTDRFIQVQQAYETLSDPTRRAMYDRDMAQGLCFAFSARKRMHHVHQDMEDKSKWKNRWEGQLSELKKRSKHKDDGRGEGGNMSWGARMRQQRRAEDESSSESS